MISRPGFLYAPPMLGHSQFAPLGESLGQAPPAAAAPQTIVIQAPAPAVAATTTTPQESGGVALIGVIAVVGAILVALEVGGVIDIFGLDKLQQKFQQKPSKNAEKA